ncbi:MAG: DUF2178 domain-containing protein [Halobacteriaceae archaeon]
MSDAGLPDPIAKQQRYRRLLLGLLITGVVGGILLREGLGYRLIGEAVYWTGIIGALAVWGGTSVRLFDERDRALERRASQLTLAIAAVVLVLGASTARVLTVTDAYDVPATAWAALWGYAALFGVFVVVYLALRSRA